MDLPAVIEAPFGLASGLSLEGSTANYSRFRSSLDTSIERHREVLHDTLPASDRHGLQRRALAELLLDHNRVFGSSAELIECISIYQDLLAPSGSVHICPSLFAILDGLGKALRARYEQLGHISDLHDAILLHECNITIQEEQGAVTASSFCNLGIAYFVRLVALSQKDDQQRAKEHLNRALEVCAADDPLRIQILAHLSVIQTHQAAAASAIASASQAFTLTPLSHPFHALACVALSSVLRLGPHTTDNVSFCAYTRALCVAIGHPYMLLAAHSFYVVALSCAPPLPRARIDDTIRTLHLLWDGTPSACWYQPWLALGLCFALCQTYHTTGGFDHLDAGILLLRQAHKEQVRRATVYWQLLHNLSATLTYRYEVVGRQDDLEEAIHFMRLCVEYLGAGEPLAMSSLAVHSMQFFYRFQRGKNQGDMERTVELQRQCLRILKGVSEHSSTTLAAIHDMMFVYLLAPQYPDALIGIDESIGMLRRICGQLNGSEKPVHLVFDSLATCLRIKALRDKGVAQMREAIDWRQKALDLVAHDRRRRLLYVSYLASDHAKLCDLEQRHDHDSMHRAEEYFTEVIDDKSLTPPQRLHFANDWCNAAANAMSTVRTRAFGKAVSLLPYVVGFCGNSKTRLEMLKLTPRLSTDAAMHAIACGDCALALQTLEKGRALLWAQMLSRKGNIPGLTDAMSKRVVEISRDIEMGAGSELSLSKHHRLMTELNEVLAEARQTPELERLLNSPSSMQAKSTISAPLIVLVCNEKSAAALIIPATSSGLRAVLLEGVDRNVLQTKLTTLNTEAARSRNTMGVPMDETRKMSKISGRRRTPPPEYDVLAWLWNHVASPIIRDLGLQIPRDTDSRPRVFWCPTGPFAFLPIHAAGTYLAKNAECVSDYVVSSYTPTISALLNAQRDAPTRPLSRVLLAAIPYAPGGWAPLPDTLKEAQEVQARVPQTRALVGVTGAEFLTELPDAACVHLACHGTQDPQDPLSSGFVFHDGILRVERLMEVHVPDACFAFLSACESAAGDRELPDESIHLAATMLSIGYRSVVGTLWSMYDVDGPNVASRIYSELLKNGNEFDYEAIPRALDAAMRELKDAGINPSRWATWIHMGI